MSAHRLVDRDPHVDADQLIAAMIPPPRFDPVRFDNYLPNPAEPSQKAAVVACRAFADTVTKHRLDRPWWRTFFAGPDNHSSKPGLYLDGGFGVGKTHLLASLWHAVPEPKAYGTFVELTHVVGALGFSEAVRRLSTHRLVAIDEFELDDPGDTMLVTRLVRELTNAGVFIAATSNTLPDKLGEGRFAAEDFLREIHALSAQFTVVRVNGPDYRHRGTPSAPIPFSNADITNHAARYPESTVDDFDALCAHLAALHPSRYGRLLDGVPLVHLRNVETLHAQDVALRLVVFADRLYDRAIPVMASGVTLSELFSEDMLRGGYRKKYFRALSRLIALSKETPLGR